MAFTRKMLKALGIEDEKIEQIMDAHTEVTESLKADRDKYKGDAEKLETVQKELDGLKAKGDDGYKEKYEAEKKAHDELKANVASEKAYASKEAAYRELLKAANIDKDYIDTIVLAEKPIIDGLTLKEDGKIDNANDLAEKAQQKWHKLVVTTKIKTAEVEKPPANNGGAKMTMKQIFEKDEHGHYVLPTQVRQKAIAESLNERN